MAAIDTPTLTGETAERKVRRPAFGSPHVYVLAVIDGEEPNAVHRIVRAETVIGRGAEADFVLEDDEVSKQHCMVRADGPVCTITDLGSLNGTKVNNRPLREGVAVRIRHLDEIELGTHRLFFMSGRGQRRPKRRLGAKDEQD